MKKHLIPYWAAAAVILAYTPAETQETTEKIVSSDQPAGTIDASLANEVNVAIGRGLDWLAAQQKEDGSWSDSNFPALTGLALQPFINSKHPDKDKIIEKAVNFIKTYVRDNGGIYKEVPGRKGGGLSNYNTAICMMALHATGRKDLAPIILKARKFVASSQYLSGIDDYRGGFGYDKDTNRAYTDLLNTYYSAEAMAKTKDVEDLRNKSEKPVDIDKKELLKSIERLQNKPEAGPDDAGGMFYNPKDPKAGTTTNANNVVVFRSYASITYAGMLAMIYADLPKDDPRVLSAFDWARKHWTLEENPGMGAQGLYFFYNILSKCLSALDKDLIPVKDNKFVNWREDLAEKLVNLQKIDEKTGTGYWENTINRYMEEDKVLVTAYTLLALQLAAGDSTRVK